MAGVDSINRGRRPAAGVAKGRRRVKKRKSSHALYYILITVFLLAVGVALSLTVFFKIESVTVVGADKYPPDEMAAESGINAGDNLFRIDGDSVKRRLLEKYPYVDDVQIRLKLPHSVQLQITQCVPAGALRQGDDILIITREGKVLERGLLLVPENIPLITGIYAGQSKPGDMLAGKEGDTTGAAQNEEIADALLVLDYLFKAAEETGFGEITNVNLSDRYNVKVVYENRLLLNLGTEFDFADKLNFLKEAITNRLPADAQGLIDASEVRRSLNYTPMSIEDALAGKRHNTKAEREAMAGWAQAVIGEEPEEEPVDNEDKPEP